MEIEILSLIFINDLIIRDAKNFKKTDIYISLLLLKENFVKSIMLVATECVLFNHDSKDIFFNKIASKEFLDLDLFDFWKILNPIINLKLIMDYNITCYLIEVEILLITFLLWKNSEKFNKEFQDFINSKDFECNFLNFYFVLFLFYFCFIFVLFCFIFYLFIFLVMDYTNNLGINLINFSFDEYKYNFKKKDIDIDLFVASELKRLRFIEFNNQTLLSFL
jgi:hypothetical protein